MMGIQEKKQQREIEEFLAGEGLVTLRAATGNDSVTASFAPVGEMTVQHLRIALGNVKKAVDGVAMVCEDADYKAELAKIGTFVFTAVAEIQRKELGAFVNVDLDGTTMSIEVCGTYDANSSSGTVDERIRSKY